MGIWIFWPASTRKKRNRTDEDCHSGDSAGEGLARILADYLADRYEVVEVSRTNAGPDPFYANLADRVASQVMDGAFDRRSCAAAPGLAFASRQTRCRASARHW